MLGNGRAALADAIDICTSELEILIDRHFAAHRELIVEREGTKWTAAIGDDVLFRSPDRRAVLRFARTFADRTPGVTLEDASADTWSVKVPDNVVAIR